ncbi:biotin--[acetyl-CoA-carboxylase] ligase [Mucilaginibacter boryungensis]
MAESQFAGRGQQTNRWHSEAGKNLTFSLLLKPGFLALQQQFDLTRVISLGVVTGLQQATGLPVQIKWPNDIYVGEKKLGGILIENLVQGSTIKNSVIGIGLNINQESFPPEVPNPTSVKQILQKDYDLNVLLSQICGYIEAWYLKLKAGRLDEIREHYLANLYWLNHEHKFMSDDGVIFTGTITAVRNNGFLVLSTKSGEKEFTLKQIQFLNKPS